MPENSFDKPGIGIPFQIQNLYLNVRLYMILDGIPYIIITMNFKLIGESE
jgi:hypothetical protein